MGLTIVIPLLAIYSESFGASAQVASLLMPTYAACQLVSGPLLGQLADRMGRKPLLLVSQVGTFIGFFVLGRATTLWMVFVSRAIDGITAGNLSLAQAYVSDVTTKENRAKSFGLIGIALSCTATSLAMTACVRAVSVERRSMTLGVVSAAGSLGTLVGPLSTQAVLSHEPWQTAAFFFVLAAVAMLPAAFCAGGADRFPGHSTATTSMRAVLGQAVCNRPFLVMSGAYFVCGLNLVFLTTHLPAYLTFCGQNPMLSAEALAVIGGVSAIGSLATGWLGSRFPKHILLGLLYILR